MKMIAGQSQPSKKNNMTTSKKEKLVQISYMDFWSMLLSTIRYSMGRQTYMPSTCISMCKDYGKYLNTDQKKQIIREIKRELELYESMKKTLGAECDHRTWTEGYQELENVWNLKEENVS